MRPRKKKEPSKEQFSVYECNGEKCRKVVRVDDGGADSDTLPTGGSQCSGGVVIAGSPPIRHEGCPGKGSLQIVNMWYCRFCGDQVDPLDVRDGKGKQAIQSGKNQSVEFTYEDFRPLEHKNCGPLEDLRKEMELPEQFAKHCFLAVPDDRLARQIIWEVLDKTVQEGEAQLVPGIDILGRGLGVKEENWPEYVHAAAVESVEKAYIVDKSSLIQDAPTDRKSLLGQTSNYYVPGGVTVDTQNVWNKHSVDTGDDSPKEYKGSANVGFSFSTGEATAASLGAELRSKIEVGEGSKTLTCVFHCECARLSLDPELSSSEAFIVKKYKNNLNLKRPDHEFVGVFGNMYAKRVFLGGTLEIKMKQTHGKESRSKTGRAGFFSKPFKATADVGGEITSKTNGERYECSFDLSGGGEIENKNLQQASVEELLDVVDKWKRSITHEYKNLQVVRVLVGPQSELAHARDAVPIVAAPPPQPKLGKHVVLAVFLVLLLISCIPVVVLLLATMESKGMGNSKASTTLCSKAFFGYYFACER